MPKDLIPANWVKKPCQFLLPLDAESAAVCGECEGEFSLLNRRRHCLFCGYVFHKEKCSQKISIEGEFFKQRICSRCHYYRATAVHELIKGEDFECIETGSVTISLDEQTAEVILHWKSEAITETADLGQVDVRKGFSHMYEHVHGAGGDYEPLKSFSVLFEDTLGEQHTYHLKAPSALTCQLWVEGLKAAGYVYQKMLEQDRALKFYSEKGSPVTSRWYRQLYLPLPPSTKTCDPSEDWEDIPLPAASSVTSALAVSGVFSPHLTNTASTPFSSGYLSDLSMSFSSQAPRHCMTVHSLPFNTGTAGTATSSATRKHSSSRSLPPTPGLTSHSSMCHCHNTTLPSAQGGRPSRLRLTSTQSNPLPSITSISSLDKCCEECRDLCKLAFEMDHL